MLADPRDRDADRAGLHRFGGDRGHLLDVGVGRRLVAQRALAYAQPYEDAIISAHAYAGLGGGMAEGTFYGNFTAFAQTLTAEALYTGAGVQDAYTRSPFYAARLRYALHASWP